MRVNLNLNCNFNRNWNAIAMKKDEEERIKKFNEVTDKHHKAMIKSLNEQAVRQK